MTMVWPGAMIPRGAVPRRDPMRRLVCSLALCALTPALTAAQPAAASWSVQPSPNVPHYSDYLAHVAATSASSAWAVGFSATGSTGTNRTLIEHWDGQRWAVQPSPNVGSGRNDLTGVAATSASNAWAVGYVFRGSGIQTLIEHWDGQRWAVQSSPGLSGQPSDLYGVTAISASSAWAVGRTAIGTGAVLIE